MSELIDRQEALNVIREMPYIGLMEKEALLDAVKGLHSAQPDIDKQELLQMIRRGIFATSDKDIYSCGIRNGMRWCMALLEEDAPKFEDASLYVRQERKKGMWLDRGDYCVCNQCWHTEQQFNGVEPIPRHTPFCAMCGADMREENENAEIC